MKKARALRVFAVSCAALLLLLAAVELAFRNVPQLMLPEWQIRHLQQEMAAFPLRTIPDAEIGFLGMPNQRVAIRTGDFDYVFERDHQGFVNREPRPAQAGIVFLGDSLVESEGVNIEQSFPDLVDRKLPDAAVVNLAVTAADPERQFRIYQRFGRPLRPRIVVAGWYLASDLSGEERFTEWLRDRRGETYEDFRRHDATPPPANKKKLAPHRWLLRHSWFLANTHERLRRWLGRSRPGPESRRFPNGDEVLFQQKALDFALHQGPGATVRVEESMRSLERLRIQLEADGTKLIVMLIPSKEELFAPGARPEGPAEVVELRRRLRAAGVDLLDLYPALRAAGTRSSPYFRRDIHLNAFGHRVVADEILGHLGRMD